jgi:hypothetical protein
MSKVAYAIFKENAQDPKAPTLARVISDNLKALTPDPSKSLWVMLESPAEFRFDRFQGSTDWAKWSAGRIFGATGELRFWRREDFTHVVLLTDDDEAQLRHLEQPYELKDYACSEQSVYLWGKRDKNTDMFIEARLPRDLKYPVPSFTIQPKLKVKAYSRNGVAEFVRFCEVTG